MKDNRQPDGTGATPSALVPEVCLRSFRECFNTGRFYEAHEVLETLWLPVRRTAEGEIWKGLIQLAAAFVHVQHGRRGPARALLRTARARFLQAGAGHPLVDLPAAVAIAESWEERIAGEIGGDLALLLAEGAPRLDPPATTGLQGR
jgi:hypothetical protein